MTTVLRNPSSVHNAVFMLSIFCSASISKKNQASTPKSQNNSLILDSLTSKTMPGYNSGPESSSVHIDTAGAKNHNHHGKNWQSNLRGVCGQKIPYRYNNSNLNKHRNFKSDQLYTFWNTQVKKLHYRKENMRIAYSAFKNLCRTPQFVQP